MNEPSTSPGRTGGVVLQEAALFPWLTVLENVIFGPRTQGLPARDYEARGHDLLKIVGPTDFGQHLPVQLSGGMRQPVGIARILTMASKALLMGEPFGALDAQTRLTMQELLLSVWQQLQPTIVFARHGIDEPPFPADTLCVMRARPGRRVVPAPWPNPAFPTAVPTKARRSHPTRRETSWSTWSPMSNRGVPHRFASFGQMLDLLLQTPGVCVKQGHDIAHWFTAQVPAPGAP